MQKRNILITGANRGIGFEIAKQLLAQGHRVIVGVRNADLLKATADKLGEGALCIQLDVTADEDIANAVKKISSKYEYLDVLVNNAGLGVGSHNASTADFVETQAIFNVNFFGAWKLSVAMLPLLKRSKYANIINISSGMGQMESLTGGFGAYRLSKFALNGLTQLMANELRGEVAVNAMCPGWVRTDMGGSSAERPVEKGAETAVWLANLTNIPTGKLFRDMKEVAF